MNQEPSSNEQIEKYVRQKHGATFPLFEKISVNGKNPNEVFKYLRCNSELWDPEKKKAKELPWNFAKFLMNANGHVVRYYNPRVNPI